MKQAIEVEIRGPLSKKGFEKLKFLLHKKGKFLGSRKRLILMYFRDRIPKDIREIEDEVVDLRLRITNGKCEIVLKYGLFRKECERIEVSVHVDKKDFENAVNLLKYLGWKIAVAYATKVYTYEYKKVKISLVEILKTKFRLFEAEKMSKKGKIKKAKAEIRKILSEFGLREFSEREFNEMCNHINNNKTLQFNFDKHSFKHLKEKFPEFFS